MKINKEGKLEINLEDIVEGLSEEDLKAFVKTHCISSTVIDWVTNWILGKDEDGWWTTGDSKLREGILFRIEEKQIGYVTQYNWSLIKEARDRLKEIKSQEHIYWKLYHHPDRDMTIREFIGQCVYEENEFSTKRADEKIQEVIDIVKNAIKTK